MVPHCVRNSSPIYTDVDLLAYILDISTELGSTYTVNLKNASKVLLVMLKINFGSDGAQPTFLWHERCTCYQLSYQGVNLHATLLTNKAE